MQLSRANDTTSAVVAALLLGAALLLPQRASATAIADVAYRTNFGERLTASLYLNGQGPFEFLIDTASTRTILYEHVRARIGIAPSGTQEITVHGVTGTAISPPYPIAELKIGGARIENLTVAVLQDPSASAQEPDGVLGIDVLARFVVQIDHATEHLQLYEPESAPRENFAEWPSARLTPERPGSATSDLWFFDTRFAFAHIKSLLDLGSGITILNWPAARLLVRTEDLPSRSSDKVRDALGKSTPAFLLVGMNVRIGGRGWEKQSALVADTRIFDLLGLAQRPAAIIGTDVLARQSIVIDFPGRRLYIEPAP